MRKLPFSDVSKERDKEKAVGVRRVWDFVPGFRVVCAKLPQTPETEIRNPGGGTAGRGNDVRIWNADQLMLLLILMMMMPPPTSYRIQPLH